MGHSRCALLTAGLLALLVARPANAGDLQVDGKFVSTAVSGPPIEVASSQLVTGLNADLLDGLSVSELARTVEHVVIVAKSGGEFSTIQAAVDSITDATGDNRYLVWIGPGIYEERVVVNSPWIFVEGAGEHLTTIRAINTPDTAIWGGCAVRHLTIEVQAASEFAVSGIYGCGPDSSLDVHHVTIEVAAPLGLGILCHTSTVELTLSHVKVSVSSAGGAGAGATAVSCGVAGPMRLSNVEATGTGGVNAKAISLYPSAGVTASGWGIIAENVDAYASGGSESNVAFFANGDSDSPRSRLSHVTALAEGGNSAVGMKLEGSDFTLESVAATVRSSVSQTAAALTDGTFEVFQSRLLSTPTLAAQTAVDAGEGASLSIVHSQLEGALASFTTGQYSCLGNYDRTLSAVICPP